ncbi:MAG: hypothetical protein LBG20_04105 [Holosporaceae bacterium]|jgi:dihydrofolate synthase/folylpolyglutamate synthase|nr:hypothetical protein [Holosporaceae bacterium]
MQDIIRFLENQRRSHDVDMLKRSMVNFGLAIDQAKVIVVAGTNGKGSTCATLQTLLMASGKSVGFLSSPHLVRINERIKFNGQDISDEDFCKVFRAVHDKVQNFDLSYFEYLTMMAVYYFFSLRNVDFALLEVGLGGTMDAVNAIPHQISVITKLGMDHGAILGDNILDIADNKFGIISEGNRVFHTKFSDDGIARLFKKIVNERDAIATEAYPYSCSVDLSDRYPSFYLDTLWGTFRMNLQGERAAENSALAITIFDYLQSGAVWQFLPALEHVIWPGRMQLINYRGQEVFLSGDHNPQGIQSLLDILQFYNFESLYFIVGICRDKNHHEMLSQLMHFRDSNTHIYLTETPVKTLHLAEYDEIFRKTAKIMSPNPILALDKAIDEANSSPRPGIIVTGSLYLLGKILVAR